MTLTYFRNIKTFKGKYSKGNISETITATATLPCTVIQLGIALGGRWHMWPWPSQKIKTLWTPFQFTDSSMPTTWPRTFIFGRMADVGSRRRLFSADFDLPLGLWYGVMWQLDLKLSLSQSAILTTMKPLSKLIDFEMLASLPTNRGLWPRPCESRSKWLDLI